MKITPTPVTAALAGAFSAITWPILWMRYGQSDTSGSMELIVATLLVVALPAHALVMGFGYRPEAHSRKLDTVLLKRVGAWLGAAFLTTALTAL
jgi:hypothetical protein